MNKTIVKTVTTRARLRNNFFKNTYEANKRAYNAQRNLCVSLVRKAKKEYFNTLDHKKITDNKTFWKTKTPCFTDKRINKESIILVENGKTLSNSQKISETLNTFFSDAVKIWAFRNTKIQ